MDERMIKLMEEQNALLREMNGKLDDIMRGVALNVVKATGTLGMSKQTKEFIFEKAEEE